MYYTVRHITRFRYSTPITESVMEVRIQPRSEGTQRCLDFRLFTSPRTQIYSYRDDDGNRVQHFDIPNKHVHLTITAESMVEITPLPEFPASLESHAWDAIDAMNAEDVYWDMLKPSHFAYPSRLLLDFMQELDIRRRDDPLTVLRDLNTAIYTHITYEKQKTRADSPIDDALRIRRGVCQDYAHIMIALVRELCIPCRYVSGYLFQQSDDLYERSSDGATHAWVEALLPEIGWVGFDPTNNILATERHIRVAVGRDYADVPPTHGIFHGRANSELAVSVRVLPAATPAISPELSLEANWVSVQTENADAGEESQFFWQQTAQQQ